MTTVRKGRGTDATVDAALAKVPVGERGVLVTDVIAQVSRAKAVVPERVVSALWDLVDSGELSYGVDGRVRRPVRV